MMLRPRPLYYDTPARLPVCCLVVFSMASSSEASRKSEAFERERGSFEKEEELSSVAQMTEIRSQLRNLLGSSPPLFGTDESETDTDKLLPKQPFSLQFRDSSASLLESLSLTPPRGDQKILTQNLERERLRRKVATGAISRKLR